MIFRTLSSLNKQRVIVILNTFDQIWVVRMPRLIKGSCLFSCGARMSERYEERYNLNLCLCCQRANLFQIAGLLHNNVLASFFLKKRTLLPWKDRSKSVCEHTHSEPPSSSMCGVQAQACSLYQRKAKAYKINVVNSKQSDCFIFLIEMRKKCQIDRRDAVLPLPHLLPDTACQLPEIMSLHFSTVWNQNSKRCITL